MERVAAVTGAVELPVLIGSGIGLDNAAQYYAACDGLLIGETDFKVDGVWGGRSLAAAYTEVALRCRG
jgi:predicted TIM-barrel enzyme